jgi:signal transduction histidine kinase
VFGLWNEAQPLTIEVVPPLWMTTGFRLFALLALLSLLLAAHWARMVSLKRRNRELQALQAEREAALERAQQSQARLEEAYAGLRGLTARLESAKEEERQLLSRELHDGLGQLLTAAKLNLQLARRDGGGEDTLRRIDESVAMIDRTITQARDISRLLRPPLLDEAGLVPALEAHLGELSRHLGMPIEVEAAADLACDQPETRTTVFRVVQEAVNNALRHAGATRVQVKLAARDGAIDVCVTDDGRGFDPQATAERVRRGEHLGLLGMSERVRGAGGEFTIEARPGEGSTVRARIPA